MALLNALPSALAQGLIWGIMAIGVYITYKILEVSDLTVDGSFATGGAVFVVLMAAGWNVWLAMVADWIVRICFFLPRILSGKWKKFCALH